MLRVALLSVCLTLALAQEPTYTQEPSYDSQGYESQEGSNNMFGDMDMSMLMSLGTFEYDVWGQIIENIPFSEILDESTSSGLVNGFEAVWGMLKQDMCYSSVETCDAAMFLDCNCIKKFTTMENPKCNTVLCDIYNGVWDNLAKWLNAIRTLNSFEEFVAYVNEEILTDVMAYTCECQDEIFKSAISCVSKYDSMMLKTMLGDEESYTMYKKIMKKINWTAIKKLLENSSKHACSSVNSEECYYSYFQVWQNMAAMFDNTFNGEGTSCNSFIDIIKWMSEMDEPQEDMSSIMTAAFKMNKKWMCNNECAQDKKEMFWSNCCVVASTQDKQSVNALITIANNVMPILSQFIEEESMPKKLTRKCMNQIRAMSNPLAMCKSNKKTNKVWSDVISTCKNEQGSFYDVVEAAKRK